MVNCCSRSWAIDFGGSGMGDAFGAASGVGIATSFEGVGGAAAASGAGGVAVVAVVPVFAVVASGAGGSGAVGVSLFEFVSDFLRRFGIAQDRAGAAFG